MTERQMDSDPFSITNGGLSPQMILRAAVRELSHKGISPRLNFEHELPENAFIVSVEFCLEKDELPISRSPEGLDKFNLKKIVPAMDCLSKQFTGAVDRTYLLPVSPGSERVNYDGIAMRARRLGETKLVLEVAYS